MREHSPDPPADEAPSEALVGNPSPLESPDISSYQNFGDAAKAVLKFLQDSLGFDLWMVTRTVEDNWIILETETRGSEYTIQAGDVFRWSASFCARMVAGQGPCIAPDSEAVPVYQEAPIAQQLTIGAYVGVPLRYKDGKLFGTLCAIHPEPMSAQLLLYQEPLLKLLARLLCSLLDMELNNVHQIRRAERAEVEAMTDGLTTLYNRRGWNQLLNAEEERCRQYGYSACIVALDLDNLKQINDTHGHAAGDTLLQKTAHVLKQATRDKDVVARLGGDEFAVLGVEIDPTAAHALSLRLQAALEAAQISASLGLALRPPNSSLHQAWEAADQAMYTHKQHRKQNPPCG
ncbi:MAG: sensor domain-containing diguanylate cyclase [Leptolyngbya sp.]|nr:sensor domain-containing diguanylate cyclase [Leptolyngbya sp.]